MITLPWPPRALSPNGRVHWADKHRATKAARHDAFYAAKAARVAVAAGDVPVILDIALHPPTKNLPDTDNALASCKAYLDGIADALKVNDRCFDPRPRICEPVKGGRVVVTIL